MGLFDKLFCKKEATVSTPVPECDPNLVYAPAEGTAIPLGEFPDEVFSQEALGPGCGILPTGSVVKAPFNGTVTQVIDTLHAVGLTSDSGVELLIHVGVDTVAMGGKGFSASVKTGQKVKLGASLITFDRGAIKEAGYSDAIAVIVTNGDEYSSVALEKNGEISTGAPLLRVLK